MPSIKDTFEPYDSNKPIISIKPNSEEKMLQMLLSLIPGGRALKNIHDNPEGSATKTLDLLAEDVVPGYYNVVKPLAKGEKINVDDALKEAVLVTLPMPNGARGPINHNNTNRVNNMLKRDIKQNAPTYKQDDLMKITEERPITVAEKNTAKMYGIDMPSWFADDIIYASPESVKGNKLPIAAQNGSEVKYALGMNTHPNVLSSISKLPKSLTEKHNLTPVDYLLNFGNKFSDRPAAARGIADVFSNEVLQPNVDEIIHRITAPGHEYNFTRNEIKNTPIPEKQMQTFLDNTVMLNKDEYLKKYPENKEMAKELFDKFDNTIKSNKSKEEKALDLLSIINELELLKGFEGI